MRLVPALVASVLLAGCARTPPVSMNYPLAKTALHVRVVRTVGCDASNTPVIANEVKTEVLHSADPGKIRRLDLSRVDGPLSNSELKTEFYGDGRLKSVNATTTGQAETIFKTAIQLAPLVMDATTNRVDIVKACKAFKKAFADKPLTLVFEIRDPLSPLNDMTAIPVEASSSYQYENYGAIVGDLCLRFGNVFALADKDLPVVYPEGSGYVTVAASQPALVQASVTAGPKGKCNAGELWSGAIQVAQLGKEYTIPIPRAAFFGKQVFAAAFDEAGALKEVSYNKETGAGQMLATLQSAGEALQTTDAERLAALKTEADIIAAQQRLVRCQTTDKCE